jgi:hypothetical protein
MKIRLLLFLSCVFILTACRSTSSYTPTPIPTSPIMVTVLPSSTPVIDSPNMPPANTLPANIQQQEPYNFKTSDPGFVTVEGLLLVIDPNLALPDANDAIFLVPLDSKEGIVTIPEFVVGEVPQADVDERTGDFRFTNIEPGRYAVVVLTTGGSQIPARFFESGSLAIFNIEESDIDTTIKLDHLQL